MLSSSLGTSENLVGDNLGFAHILRPLVILTVKYVKVTRDLERAVSFLRQRGLISLEDSSLFFL